MPTVNGEEQFFWTVDSNGEALDKRIWLNQGIACKVLRLGTVPTPQYAVPFIRYYNGGWIHKWTSNPARDAAYLNVEPIRVEGTACFVFSQQVANTIPFYRFDAPLPVLWSFWTTDVNGQGIANMGFSRQDAATVYVYAPDGPSASPDVVPFYRFFEGGTITPAYQVGFTNYPVNPDGTVSGGPVVTVPVGHF